MADKLQEKNKHKWTTIHVVLFSLIFLVIGFSLSIYYVRHMYFG